MANAIELKKGQRWQLPSGNVFLVLDVEDNYYTFLPDQRCVTTSMEHFPTVYRDSYQGATDFFAHEAAILLAD